MSVDRSKWPVLVQLGLWGLPGRGWAWAFFWLCMAMAIASIPLGFLLHPVCFFGILMAFASVWYYLSIRWVDENSQWDSNRRDEEW